MQFTGGAGVDAVVITAATDSNEPIEFASEACRTRGRIVLVGVVGLNIPRPPFFKKELSFTVSSSLGPGRSDPLYEEQGIDYPAGFVRWTAQRNMQACLALMSEGKLPVENLTSHRFPVDRAAEAYDLITARREPFLGIVLEYGDPEPPRRTIRFSRVSERPTEWRARRQSHRSRQLCAPRHAPRSLRNWRHRVARHLHRKRRHR